MNDEQPMLSIIIPAYNEGDTIKQTMEEVLADVSDNIIQIKITKQVIVINDGSTDQTGNILKQYAHLPNVKIITHEKNKGKGAGLKAAIPHCTGKYTIIQDADLEYRPIDYPLVLYPASMGFKAIFGSRRLNPYNERNQSSSFLYYLGGNTLTKLANLLYGTRHSDAWTGYKCIETNLLKSLNLQCDGFEICAETVAKLAKQKIDVFTVPIHFYPRTKKQGKHIRTSDGVKLALTLIKQKLKKWNPLPTKVGSFEKIKENGKNKKEG